MIDVVIVFQTLRADFLKSREVLWMASSCLYREKHSRARHFKSSRESGEISLCVVGGFNSSHFPSEPRASNSKVLLCLFL